MASSDIRPATPDDTPYITATLTHEFGSTDIFSRGRMFDALRLPTHLAVNGPTPLGLAITRFERDECELLCLVATEPRRGIGTLLLDHSRRLATEHGCRRLFLTTTNDNLDALRFYQRRGMTLASLHAGAMNLARALKPSIPAIGHHGIPIRDDLELEYIL